MNEFAIAHVAAVSVEPGDRVLDRAPWPSLVSYVDRSSIPGKITVGFDANDGTEEPGAYCYSDYPNDLVLAVVVGPNHPGPNGCATVEQAVDRIRHQIAALREGEPFTKLFVKGQVSGLYLALATVTGRDIGDLRAEPLPADPTRTTA